MSNGVENISAINKALEERTTIIHYDPNRVEFTVNDHELTQLSEIGKSSWKEFCLFCLGLCIPCIFNSFAEMSGKTMKDFTIPILLNIILGGVTFFLSVAFGWFWYKSNLNKNGIIDHIKGKPKFKLENREEKSVEIAE